MASNESWGVHPKVFSILLISGTRRFKFSSAGIPIGATLNFVKDSNLIATVITDTTVDYKGTNFSLTLAGLAALKDCGYNWTSVQGPEYWLYNGETVGSLRSQREKANQDD